jgi:hypothetical protein
MMRGLPDDRPFTKGEMVEVLVRFFGQDNARFKAERFREACRRGAGTDLSGWDRLLAD